MLKWIVLIVLAIAAVVTGAIVVRLRCGMRARNSELERQPGQQPRQDSSEP